MGPEPTKSAPPAGKYTLLWGTANPEGTSTPGSIFLNTDDIQTMIRQVNEHNQRGTPLPVLVEHQGAPVGHVVSAWEYKNTLECVLALDEKRLEGSLSSELVRAGICKDLSLGYNVNIENSKRGMKVLGKRLKEISVVMQGARKKCHIHGVSSKRD